MLTTTPKLKECAECKTMFMPQRPMARVCSPRCALKTVKTAKVLEKRQTRARKEKLQTIPELTKLAQATFNKWIRTRDEAQPCISCGKPPPDPADYQGGRDAGHFRSIGAAAHLRFYEDNCHAQCVKCNQWKAGNAVDYRLGLLARVGLVRVEAIEANNTPHKWTREELREIRATYQAKLKQLQKERS